MNLHNLRTVAAYNSRLLLRSWLFRIFFLLTFCCIILYQILIQSNLFMLSNSGLISLSSFFPYMNAYLFAGLQAIPLIFLAGMFLTKERKLDSMDTIYYRPESNAEYVLGMAAGFAGVFTVMAIVSLFFGSLLHLFASSSPMNVWIYLFYLVTLIIPALIFMVGLSFFIHTWVRNQALSILLLLMVVGFTIFYAGGMGQGVFDPFGHSLPNTFSSVTGHSDLTGYLLQRLCWLLVGFGFLGFTVCLFKRLSNRPVNRVRVMGLSIACMIAGVMAGGLVYSFHSQKISVRKVYTETYNKYNNVPKGSVTRHDIRFEQQGDEMSAKSTLLIQNRTRETLPEIILYLNPDLEVLSIKGDSDLSFERERQVIRVRRELQPDEEIVLTVVYRGGIDERICYLGVPDDIVFEQESNAYLKCRYGKRFMFLDKNFTFLTPECLWYPTTTPPVNPAHPYDVSPEFTFYSLQISNPGERTVIAQGDEEKTDNGLHFTNHLPLPGISLCIGGYEKREITVDSVRYELYLFKGHDDILRGLEALSDSLPGLIREMRETVEYQMRHSYLYSGLKLIETPITLASFFRQEKGTSEYIQPEMVFLPERGVGVWSDHKAVMERTMKVIASVAGFDNMSEMDRLRQMVHGSLTNLLTSATTMNYDRGQMLVRWFGPSAIKNVAGNNLSTRNSLYYAASMFYDYSLCFRSDDYQIINAVLLNILKSRSRDYSGQMAEERALNYLSSHSFEEAFHDGELDPVVLFRVLRMKSKELVRRLALGDMTEEQVVDFLDGYIATHRFQKIDFDQFDETFAREFGVRWRDVLPSWYTNKRLPEFWIKDFKAASVGADKEKADEMNRILSLIGNGSVYIDGLGGSASRVRLTIFNDSDVDGVVSIEARKTEGRPSSGGSAWNFGRRMEESTITRNYLIKAKSGKEIVTNFDEGMITLNTNLSLNIPTTLSGERGGTTDDKTGDNERELGRSYFLLGENVTVVDNEEEGFRIIQSSSKKRLRDLFAKEPESKYLRQNRSIQLMDGVEVRPGYVQNESAYGFSKRTHAFMMQGGGASMEWVTRIEKEGEYDVYAYIPPKMSAYRVDKEKQGKGITAGFSMVTAFSTIGSDAGFKQYYTLTNGNEEKEVVGECDGTFGWILLGRYRLSPGECKVVLTDEGEADQVLLGDAVKWEYIEDK